ncbi:MAG: hypothetical protein E7Z80_04020 [Methanobrevibacter thaueri]|nr:hypothetical protein [Methanobrevibacter thaueri]
MRKQFIYIILIILTIFDILFLANTFFYPVSQSFKSAAFTFDLIVCAILWIEFIYSYFKADDKKQYLKNNFISIFGMLPFDFIFILRLLRLIKLIQLIKILVLIRDTEKSVTKFLHKTYLDKIIAIGIIFSFVIAISVWVIDSNIHNFSTAFWYTIVSMTSTGYGDVVPTSVSGRLIGIISMIGGIFIFSLITGIISAAFVSKLNKDNHEDLDAKIDFLTAEIDKLNQKIDELDNNQK